MFRLPEIGANFQIDWKSWPQAENHILRKAHFAVDVRNSTAIDGFGAMGLVSPAVVLPSLHEFQQKPLLKGWSIAGKNLSQRVSCVQIPKSQDKAPVSKEEAKRKAAELA
jgi:hypothetical protein